MNPIKRTCRITEEPFAVSPLEQELCKKFDVPPPTICPEERLRSSARSIPVVSGCDGLAALELAGRIHVALAQSLGALGDSREAVFQKAGNE